LCANPFLGAINNAAPWRKMALRLLSAISTTGLIILVHSADAGPCARDIDSLQALVEAKIERTADTGRFAREARRAFGLSPSTPGSLPTAESLQDDAPWIGAAMAGLARARAADETSNESACGQALADVQRVLDH
jgi:hypothetical protein